ncbi:MAG TPA: PEGA domain-containing protein [Polyangia bacterium]|jgi:hypothetical protein
MLLARTLPAVLTVAAVLSSASARAQEPAPGAARVATALVAVLPPEYSQSVSEGARATLLARLVEGLKAARFDVLAGDDLTARLGGDAKAAACRTRDCYPPLSQRLRVAYLVRATVTQVERNYDIGLTLVRGRSGEAAAELHERCDICGIEEVGEKMALAASALRAKLEALMVGPARLTVRSDPPGAFVSLDGKEIGRTPLEREIPGGQHTIQVRRRGYVAAERTVMLVPELAETVEVTLLKGTATFPYATVGWSGVAAGALVIAGGIVAVALDGKQISCSEPDVRGHCPYVRNTRVLGATLTGVGAAMATAGALFVWLAADRGVERKVGAAPAVVPLPGGAALTWGRSF